MKRSNVKQIDVRFLVRVDADNYPGMSRYLRVRADLCYINPEGKVRWPSTSYDDPLAELSGLAVTAQTDDNHARYNDDVYGRNLEYLDVHSVRLVDATRMAGSLRRLHAGLDRLDDRYGYATDFAMLLGRVLDVIGGSGNPTIGYARNDVPSLDDTRFAWTDVDGIRSWLFRQVADWRGKYGIVREGQA